MELSNYAVVLFYLILICCLDLVCFLLICCLVRQFLSNIQSSGKVQSKSKQTFCLMIVKQVFTHILLDVSFVDDTYSS